MGYTREAPKYGQDSILAAIIALFEDVLRAQNSRRNAQKLGYD
jgi:hypothetical protein